MQNLLSEPFTIMLTKQFAEKLFGAEDPVGQVIEVKILGDFKVIGLIDTKGLKTHLEFDALASGSSIQPLINQEVLSENLNNWGNIYQAYIYFSLKEGRTVEEVKQAFPEIEEKYYQNIELETRTKAFSFFLQPFTSIAPGELYSNNLGSAMPLIVIKFLLVLSVVVLTAACFNFTNLSIARALKRSKEIGIRKVNGASKWQIFTQFISEAIIFSVLSLAIAYGLLKLIIPMFSQLQITQFMNISLVTDFETYLLFLGFCIITGLFAGFIPAFLLGEVQPFKSTSWRYWVKTFQSTHLHPAGIQERSNDFSVCAEHDFYLDGCYNFPADKVYAE